MATGAGIEEAVQGAERVVHLAATLFSRTAAGFDDVNHGGTRRLSAALAALPRPPRLVLCSSLAAAGPAGPSGRPSGPISHYGRSKHAGEAAVRAHAPRLPAVILRPGIVYGPGDPALVPALLPMLRVGLALKAGLGPRVYSAVHVDDLCGALLAAAERGTVVGSGDRDAGPDAEADADAEAGPAPAPAPDAGVYVISDGARYTWRDICSTLAEAARLPHPVLLPVPMPLVHAVAAVSELLVRDRVPALNRDKAREMSHGDWTCGLGSGLERSRRELGFSPALSLRDAFTAPALRLGHELG
ncbi:NAD-dependent epimerase/dehydratase family protein [Streptomyces sp. CA-181903]|uniref:NAD-dependent epimerase/dehydratase family protein n=1 Tax=Streptomyces sp. CA-181903 TaxID=3240055 RepID=UPI003D89D48F